MNYKSYRNSHKSKNHGKRYNSLYYKDSYYSRVWFLEKEALDHIYLNSIKENIQNYLDFACGTGRLFEVFEDKSNNSYGLDVSEEMLKVARSKYKKTTFINDDLSINKKIFKVKFDVITAFRFFLNAEDNLRKKILSALYNNLNDNGFLILNIHGNKYSIRYFPFLIKHLIFKNNSLNSISYKHMKSLLEENKFKVIKIYGQSYLPQIFSKIIPKLTWLKIERFIIKLRIFNKFGVGIIFLCKKIR